MARVLDAQNVVDKVLLTGGSGQMVSDESVYAWQRRLIREEGIYTEPAGATSMSGLALAVEKGQVRPEDKIVCLVTASGFKDLKSIRAAVRDSVIPLIEVNAI